MATWDNIRITTDTGEEVIAQAPIIVSASRATDIPAFYADWFMERLKRGYIKWTNPFNGKPLYISFAKTRAIVFWSKNPQPLLKHLDTLESMGHNFYFQYTLNDYVTEGYEPKVPPLDFRIETFQELSEKLGKERVIWRFDPLLITQKTPVESLLEKISSLGDRLSQYTEKLVFSFADISGYRNVQRNLSTANLNARECFTEEKVFLASRLAALNQEKKWNLHLATCAEDINLQTFGIEHNRCIDDELLMRCFHEDDVLMQFLGYEKDLFGNFVQIAKRKFDKGQRLACGCIQSKDIGEYNTCPHQCLYCYANRSPESAARNAQQVKLTDSIKGV